MIPLTTPLLPSSLHSSSLKRAQTALYGKSQYCDSDLLGIKSKVRISLNLRLLPKPYRYGKPPFYA